MVFAIPGAAAPEDVRFYGGTYDGWDRCSMTNALQIGGALISFASASNQLFDWSAGPALAPLTIDVSDPMGTMTNGGVIRVSVPAAWRCRFDTNTPVSYSGDASAKVGPARFSNDSRTAEMPVLSDFASNDTLILSGLRLINLHLVSADTRKLELDFDGNGIRDKYDEYTLRVRVLWPGGSYDGWDRTTLSTSANLTPKDKGTILILK